MIKIQKIKANHTRHLEELRLNQAHYTKTFLPTSTYLDKQGFYRKISDFVQKGAKYKKYVDINGSNPLVS